METAHVVVGAGPVGRATATHLASLGRTDVVLASRSGSGEELDGVRRVALDAADAAALSALVTRVSGGGPAVLHNCVNPPSYDVWSTWWPPVHEALLAAAERTGAVLATASCLYPYGRVTGPMTEGMPDAGTGPKERLRARMWADALQAHREGRIRAVEVRGSDYMGPGVATAHVPMVARRALTGRAVRVFGRADVPHSFTDVRDMARALVATAEDPAAHGRVWHAPTNPPVTQRQAVADVCRAAGVEPVAVRAWPRALLGLGGVVVPMLRELRETVHQFEAPYVLDSSAITRELGLAPTPWAEVCRATAETSGPATAAAERPRQDSNL
ncbi:NAD-dependent epimerase/dehydratase family protein [uncultured Nocardioides sp.]|uniref:NAD-dependent epimerase/dehydratase family protein n=1 Tax=uncultured Nocardioides sp. TaxID=198441 RepID=UPI002628B040|nr:NAD-dependent epimerase/dehydratase family protein [uncultured Nocardioides sp.]